MKAIDTLKNHICDLEKMILVFDEYATYKSSDETKKAIQELTSSETKQVLNYLAASKNKIGILANFGEDSLKYKRLIL